MQIRIVRDADLPSHRLFKGMQFDAAPEFAKVWIEAGIAEPVSDKPVRRTATKKLVKETRADA
jgi:hypothetical protein